MLKRSIHAALAVAVAVVCPARATVNAPYVPAAYSCNGTTTAYTITFPYLAASQIGATSTTAGGVVTTLVQGNDFTVSPSVAPTTGTLTLTAGSKCPAGSTLAITRSLPLTQPTSFRSQGPFNPATHESAFDRTEMQIQQLNSTIVNPVLPSALTNATPVTARGTTTAVQLQDWLLHPVNVKAYGAVGDGLVDDSAAIQAAIDKVAGGGAVFFPPGTYKANNVVWKSGVHLIGSGTAATILKSSSAAPLLKLINGSLGDHLGSIRHLSIDGNSVGTIGLQLTLVARFTMQDVEIRNFTAQGMNLSGTLIFVADRVRVVNSVVGVLANTTGGINANHARFYYPRFQNNTTYGVDWNSGSMLLIDGAEFGGNGTAANAATGSLKLTAMTPEGIGQSAVIRHSWFETNHGHSAIRINAPAAWPAVVTVTDTVIAGGTRTYGLYASGANVQYFAENVTAQNAATADFFDDNTILLGFRMNCIASSSVAGTQTTEWPRPSGAMSGQFILRNPLQVISTSSNGTIALAAGTGTATTYTGARCVCTDTTANASVKCAVSGTTLTATGTGTDVIAYHCF